VLPRPDPLADIAALIRVGAESGDPGAVRAAEALAIWLNGTQGLLEQALGAAPGIRAARRLRRRDAALRRLGRRFDGLSERAVAEAVHKAVSRYRDRGTWARDDAGRHRPDHEAGLCFDVLANGPLPGVEHLRKVCLVGCRDAGDPPSIGTDILT
jgi:hypothetical protein